MCVCIFSSIYWFQTLYGQSKWFQFTSHFSFLFVDRQMAATASAAEVASLLFSSVHAHPPPLPAYTIVVVTALISCVTLFHFISRSLPLCCCCCCCSWCCFCWIALFFADKETVNALSLCILDFVVCALELYFLLLWRQQQRADNKENILSACVCVSVCMQVCSYWFNKANDWQIALKRLAYLNLFVEF